MVQYQYFRVPCCLHLQGENTKSSGDGGSKLVQNVVSYQNTVQCCNLDDCDLNLHRHENLKSCNPLTVSDEVSCAQFPSSCGLNKIPHNTMHSNYRISVELHYKALKYHTSETAYKNSEFYVCSIACTGFMTTKNSTQTVEKLRLICIIHVCR